MASYEFAEKVQHQDTFMGHPIDVTLGPGSVTPKSEEQEFVCEKLAETLPGLVKKKGGKA